MQDSYELTFHAKVHRWYLDPDYKKFYYTTFTSAILDKYVLNIEWAAQE